MNTTIESQPHVRHGGVPARLAGPFLLLGGVAFFVGGITHPRDNGQGNKVQQLHDMLVDPSWYPSHGSLLAAMGLLAAGILALRQRVAGTGGVARLLTVVFVIACVATFSMAVHLAAAVDAEALADGRQSLVSRVQTVNETVVDAVWGLAIATLALVGGATRTVGNRATTPVGVVGGVAFAVASATIAFTDTFDALFKVGSLISVWAVMAGVIAIRHPD